MATKTTTKKTDTKAPAGKGKAKARAKIKAKKPAHGPLTKLKALHGSKESLVKKLVEPLARGDEDTDQLEGRLLKASNLQLLRLSKTVEKVQQKYGGRAKLIAAIGAATGKAKDKDYLAKLDMLTLPKLLDLARTARA